jgi:hypothetical protein
MVEPMGKENMKGNYNFRVECSDKIFFFGTEYATETNRWLTIMKRGKKTVEEI